MVLLQKTELAVVKKELTEVEKSQGFIIAKYEYLKLEHNQLLKVNKEQSIKRIKTFAKSVSGA